MSDYPNMSYCMNQNTLLALRQVINAMQEEGSQFVKELSKEERRAWEELFHACQDFCDRAEDLEFELEEFDGQPDEAQEWYDFDPDC